MDQPKTINKKNWTQLILVIAIMLVAAGVFWKKSASLFQQSAPITGGGDVVEDFTLPDTNGRMVKLSEYVKGRPFVISFGTTSCPYCELQTKAFDQLKAQLGDQVAILEVNVGEPPDRVARHIARTNRKIPTLIDQDGSIYMRYGSEAVPVTVIADKSAKILEIGNYITTAQLTAKLKPALAQPKTAR